MRAILGRRSVFQKMREAPVARVRSGGIDSRQVLQRDVASNDKTKAPKRLRRYKIELSFDKIATGVVDGRAKAQSAHVSKCAA